MVGIVDRFEGDWVVIEVDGQTRDVQKEFVDARVKVNDVVEWINEKWVVNEEATKKRQDKIKILMDSVWEE